MEKELLSVIYTATLKCLNVAQKITCVNDIKKSMVYENLISNLMLIKDTEAKLSNETKAKLNTINWDKFEKYDKEIISDLHETNDEVIYMIIKEELPVLFEKLERVFFS